MFLATVTHRGDAQSIRQAMPSINADAEEAWVNSTFQSLTEDERLGQLIMIRAHSNLGKEHIRAVENTIKKYQVGGLCFFQGTPEKQLELTNHYQSLAKTPLLISMDAEWGLGMRLPASTISFPRQLTLGAIQDNRLIYELGKEVARQCRRIGVHINFAPVVDVNNNPNNPVINTRSFGEDRYNVTAKSYMYMKGMQDHLVMACAKHFPGHGDTDTDSHLDLPIISHNRQRLDSIEMFPFRILSKQGIQSMMVAHLNVPAIDATTKLPTTLSPKAVNQILINEMGFEGLIFTDGLEMKGVTKLYGNGEIEAKALEAGNDILLLPEDIEASIQKIKQYINEGKLSWAIIDDKVKKVLRAKFRLGLTQYANIPTEGLRSDLNSTRAHLLKRELIQNALTLVRNRDQLIPFNQIDSLDIASVSLGTNKRTIFQETLQKFGIAHHYQLAKNSSKSQQNRIAKLVGNKDAVLVSLHSMNASAAKNFGITPEEQAFIETLQSTTKVILVVFGSPYSLKTFDGIDWVLNAYAEDEVTQDLAAQGLFGVFGFQGRLPVTASPKSRFGDGIDTPELFRLGYAPPEAVGLNPSILHNRIDELANEAIAKKATPGCVVLVAKNGKIVFEKAYGYHTYSKRQRMQMDDVFDLASVTKVAATTLSVMKLHDEGKINIHQPMSQFLPLLQGTNKADLTIEEIMAHRAGLRAWIPFYEKTVTKSKRSPRPMTKYYSKKQTDEFSIPVTNRLFMRNDYRDSIWQEILTSELRPNRNYRYSDLGFYLSASMVQAVSGKTVDGFAYENFYKELGLKHTTYNPHLKFTPKEIVPTEEDRYFRRQRVHGYVHDMGAAMLGGVSGHAGLFSTARELVVIMQMLLNGGYYGGKRYLSSETVRTFTTRFPTESRRGIGFDMKELSSDRNQNMSERAPASTFGHLGFTGTCTWVDPVNDIIYVFLSNRTYPSMHNFKLSKMDTRPKIQTAIYEAMQ